MKHLILILGDLASGKSTFADILSDKHKIPAIKKDRIKEILADTVGFDSREENLKLSRATFEVMLHIFERSAQVSADLILESNFRQSELERLAEIAKNKDYKILSLYLTADTDILYERFRERKKTGRHRAHLITEFENYEGFKKYVTAQRCEHLPGEIIKINARDFSYQSDCAILNKIDLFLKN